MTEFPKVELVKSTPMSGGNIKGVQSYKVDYYLKTDKFPDKIRFCIIAPGKTDEQAFLSLYLLDPAQLDIIIKDLILARSFFAWKRGDLSEFNIHYWQQQFSRRFLELEKDVLRGVYDG